MGDASAGAAWGYRFAAEWNTGGINDSAHITDIILGYEGTAHEGGLDDEGYIKHMENQPSGVGDAEELWLDCGNGTVYVTSDAFPVVGGNKNITLGADAEADMEALLASDWFAIGAHYLVENGNHDPYAFVASRDDGGGNPKPTLFVTYSMGTSYIRDTDIDLLWTSLLARQWTLTRVGELALSFSINVSRILSAVVAYIRDLSLEIYLDIEAEFLKVLASGWALFTVQVVDRFDVAIAEAEVSVWVIGGSHSFSDATNSTGFTDPGQNITQGNYTVMVSRDDYFPAQVAVGLTHDHILKVVLSTYVINIEVALLALIGVAFAIFHLRTDSIPSGLIGSTFSFGTVLVWLGAGSPVPALAWLFAIFGAVILISTGRSFIEWWGDSRREW